MKDWAILRRKSEGGRAGDNSYCVQFCMSRSAVDSAVFEEPIPLTILDSPFWPSLVIHARAQAFHPTSRLQR
jgi:hypothetical protein